MLRCCPPALVVRSVTAAHQTSGHHGHDARPLERDCPVPVPGGRPGTPCAPWPARPLPSAAGAIRPALRAAPWRRDHAPRRYRHGPDRSTSSHGTSSDAPCRLAPTDARYRRPFHGGRLPHHRVPTWLLVANRGHGTPVNVIAQNCEVISRAWRSRRRSAHAPPRRRRRGGQAARTRERTA
jgi:hypothetical protein